MAVMDSKRDDDDDLILRIDGQQPPTLLNPTSTKNRKYI